MVYLVDLDWNLSSAVKSTASEWLVTFVSVYIEYTYSIAKLKNTCEAGCVRMRVLKIGLATGVSVIQKIAAKYSQLKQNKNNYSK